MRKTQGYRTYPAERALPAFLIRFLARLQELGTVPAIDSRFMAVADPQSVDAPIGRKTWNSCGASLRRGKVPPLSLDFLFEGEHRIISRDLHGGIVCLAIACELLIRVLVLRPTNRRFLPLLKRTRVMNILDQWDNIGPTGKRINQAMNRENEAAVSLRNDIMHAGHVHELTDAECQSLGGAARRVIMIGSSLASVSRIR